MLKRRAIVFGSLAGLTARSASAEGPQITGAIRDYKPIENGGLAPEVPIMGFDGNMHVLSELRGKVLAVNFWATWCAPCFQELPEFDKLQARLGGADFSVVLVNQ